MSCILTESCGDLLQDEQDRGYEFDRCGDGHFTFFLCSAARAGRLQRYTPCARSSARVLVSGRGTGPEWQLKSKRQGTLARLVSLCTCCCRGTGKSATRSSVSAASLPPGLRPEAAYAHHPFPSRSQHVIRVPTVHRAMRIVHSCTRRRC